MVRNFKDKITLSGITVLIIGVALLIFTFISAFGFLTRSLSIVTSENLEGTFGGALAPLVEACIHIMYLGVMGWIGSLLTIRGVNLISNAPKAVEVAAPQKPVVPQQKPVPPQQKAKAEPKKEAEPQKEVKPEVKPSEPEVKPSEPEFVVIPPEQVSQPQPQAEQPEQQKNDSSPQQPANQ